MKLKISQAKSMLIKTLRANLVALISGSPGAGKSALVKAIADEFGLYMIDVRLAQCDPTDLLGFPTIDADTKRASYAPMETFPLEGDPVPEGYNGWMLFLDEITGAPESVQKAAYKLIYDKMVGDRHIHQNVVMIAAGNLETDNALVEPMSTALQSRMIHLELVVDEQEWVDWAASQGIDQRICSFIRFKPSALYTFKPDHTDSTYACPRTWEFADRFLKQCNDVTDNDALPGLAGTLSEGVAMEFISFCKIYQDLPKIADITGSPATLPIPKEPSVLFAITGALASAMKESNAEKLMIFISRLPVEFQVVTLRDVVRRNPSLQAHSSIQKWIVNMGAELF